jgi:hypothetical protein
MQTQVVNKLKKEVKNETKSEVKKEINALIQRSQSRVNRFLPFGGSSSMKPSKRQLHVSRYLYSLMDPEALNVPSPDLGPYPTRQFTVITKFVIKTNASGVCAWSCDPGQLHPSTPTASSTGFWVQYYGTTVDGVGGATIIGEGQTYNTCGPTWLDSVSTLASQAYLNSACMEVDYIGGTFNDSGIIAYAIIATQDYGTSEVAPPYSEKIATLPMGGSSPAPAGVSLPWIPVEYGVPLRTYIDDYSNRTGAGPNYSPGSMYWRVYAETGVTSGDAFLVTVVQNFSFVTNTKTFASSEVTSVPSVRGLQREVERAAVGRMASVGSGSDQTPLAAPRASGDKEPSSMTRKLKKNRLNSLKKFLKEGWDAASPFVKLLWNNRTKLGEYANDFLSPASPLPALPESSVIIEEVAEEAPVLALAAL